MEGGVAGVGREMRRGSIAARVFGSMIGKIVSGDLIARGLTAVIRRVRQFIADSVQAAINADSLARSMRAVTGDAGDAAKAMEFVSSEADRLGIGLATSEQAFVKLVAATRGTSLEGAATRDIFSGIAEAARAMGLSVEAQRGALTAIEQIISKGTVSAEELRGQLGERLPGAFRIAARAAGVTTAELGKMPPEGRSALRGVFAQVHRGAAAPVQRGRGGSGGRSGRQLSEAE